MLTTTTLAAILNAAAAYPTCACVALDLLTSILLATLVEIRTIAVSERRAGGVCTELANAETRRWKHP